MPVNDSFSRSTSFKICYLHRQAYSQRYGRYSSVHVWPRNNYDRFGLLGGRIPILCEAPHEGRILVGRLDDASGHGPYDSTLRWFLF